MGYGGSGTGTTCGQSDIASIRLNRPRGRFRENTDICKEPFLQINLIYLFLIFVIS